MQEPLRFLAMGDSLTAGLYRSGLSSDNHPYSIHLTNLFSSANIPIIVNEKGISGERVVSPMVKRFENLTSEAENNFHYDWIIILGGTNDLGHGESGERIFNEGLKLMYDMVLHRTNNKTKLAVMTVIQNGLNPLEEQRDKARQNLNEMIRNYVQNEKDQKRICLVDLDKGIPYHTIRNSNERKLIWSDVIHLTPAGYDKMATLIFKAIIEKLNE